MDMQQNGEVEDRQDEPTLDNPIRLEVSRPKTFNNVLAFLGAPVMVVLFIFNFIEPIFGDNGAGIFRSRVIFNPIAVIVQAVVSVKGIMLLPSLIVLVFLWVITIVTIYVNYFLTAISGQYNRGFFNLTVNVSQWSVRVWGYLVSWSDTYPPFNFDKNSHLVKLNVLYPEKPSRFLAILGILIVVKPILVLPHSIVLFFVSAISYLMLFAGLLMSAVSSVYWEPAFRFSKITCRWQLNVAGYIMGWTDLYPPFLFGELQESFQSS